MRIWATFAIAIGLVLGGFPRLCGCDCAQVGEGQAAAQAAAVPACPHCRPDESDPAPHRPQPCECGNCEVAKAARVGSQVKAPLPDSPWRVQLAPVALHVQPTASPASVKLSRTGPPGMVAPLGCSIPILLGHLLF